MCVNFFALATQDISIGDINEDGEISIADVVTLSGYLLGRAPLSDSQKQAADLTDDGKLNVFDLILLKREVTKNKMTIFTYPGNCTFPGYDGYSV